MRRTTWACAAVLALLLAAAVTPGSAVTAVGRTPATTVASAAEEGATAGARPRVRLQVPSARAGLAPRLRFRVTWRVDGRAGRVELQRRARAWSGGVGTWDRVATRGARRSTTYRARQGRTTCLRARALTGGRPAGPWSPLVCVTTPLDDRALAPSPRWDRDRDIRDFHHTYTATRQRGARLLLAGVVARRVALLVRPVRYGGRVAVRLDGRRVGAASLVGGFRRQVVRPVGSLEQVRRGRLSIRVTSRARPVHLDGVYLVP